MSSLSSAAASARRLKPDSVPPMDDNASAEPELRRLSNILKHANLSVVVSWPGKTCLLGRNALANPPKFLFLSRDCAVQALSTPTLRSLASAYINGDLDIRGDLLRAMPIVEAINVATDHAQTFRERVGRWLYRSLKAVSKPAPHSFESLNHYAKSTDAFEGMLDPYMQYTCGLYTDDNCDLNAAQLRKFEFVRDLFSEHMGDIRGKTHLDIGCGWGGLVYYFRENFGTDSIGITNSPQQLVYAKAKFDVPVEFGDFSSLRRSRARYDLVTIVGMIEHLTPWRRNELLRLVKRSLTPGGLVYLQCIQRPAVWIGGDAYRLAQELVFPGHFLESERGTVARLERSGFEILSSWEHGPHYALTTAAWLTNIDSKPESFRAILGDRDYRIFRGYLALASQLFGSGRGSLKRYLLRAL